MGTKSDNSRYARAMRIAKVLEQATAKLEEPAVTQIINEYGRNPFFVLVSCLLSLRTKDTISLPVSRQLFNRIKTPQELLDLPLSKLQKIVYPTGFFRQKAKTLHAVSRALIKTFNGTVPKTEEELLSLPGVGRKTANLVLGEAFGVPAICVDVHVHRISNRLGLVKTKTPEQTEVELKKILPKHLWISWNRLLVIWGQQVCLPRKPRCASCAIRNLCRRVGVWTRKL